MDSTHRFVTDAEKNAWNAKAASDLSNVTLAKNLTSQTSGYYKAPDGLMLQWGRKTGNSSGKHTIYFPVAFLYYPTAIICTYEWATNTGQGALSLLVKNRSTTQFEVVAQWASENKQGMASEAFFWLAVGRWK